MINFYSFHILFKSCSNFLELLTRFSLKLFEFKYLHTFFYLNTNFNYGKLLRNILCMCIYSNQYIFFLGPNPAVYEVQNNNLVIPKNDRDFFAWNFGNYLQWSHLSEQTRSINSISRYSLIEYCGGHHVGLAT